MGGNSGSFKKGIRPSPETEFKKGHKPIPNRFKEGYRPWNYIDGRSKDLGPGRYGCDWAKIRELIFRRDNYTCQFCSLTKEFIGIPLHVHHKIPFLISFDNSQNNLITLCPSCHRFEEVRIMRDLKKQEILL